MLSKDQKAALEAAGQQEAKSLIEKTGEYLKKNGAEIKDAVVEQVRIGTADARVSLIEEGWYGKSITDRVHRLGLAEQGASRSTDADNEFSARDLYGQDATAIEPVAQDPELDQGPERS